jgi:hypothetical protein
MQLPSVQEMEAYIRQAAQARGIDPDIAVRVARSEGLAPNTWQATGMLDYGRERSYGPFQLHVAPKGYRQGLGNDFVRATGMNPADPSTWKQGIDFALDTAAKDGWGRWFGRKNVNVGIWDGIAGAKALGVSPAEPQGAGPGRGTMAGYRKPAETYYPPGSPYAETRPGEEITFYADNSPALPQGGAGTDMGGFMGGPRQVTRRQQEGILPNIQPAVGQTTEDFRPTLFQKMTAQQAFDDGDRSQLDHILKATGLDPTGKKRLYPRGMSNQAGILSMLQGKMNAPKMPASGGGILGGLLGKIFG